MKIQYKVSKDIFFLFCALNLMGYADENNAMGMHPLRKKVRKSLLQYHWPKKYPKLELIFHQYHAHSLIIELLKRPLKHFRQCKKIYKQNSMEAYLRDLKLFSKEPMVNQFWPTFKNALAGEAKKTLPLFKKNVIGLLEFINKPINKLQKIILIPNILDAYWRGYGVEIKKTGYVIVGPGAKDNDGKLLRHELLHMLAPNFKLPSKIVAENNKAQINMGYNDQNIVNCEYVVRGLDFLYESMVLRKNISATVENERKDFPKIKNVIKILEQKIKKRG